MMALPFMTFALFAMPLVVMVVVTFLLISIGGIPYPHMAHYFSAIVLLLVQAALWSVWGLRMGGVI